MGYVGFFIQGCKFEHTKLSIHFESFNDECAIVKEAQDESGIKTNAFELAAELVTFKIVLMY